MIFPLHLPVSVASLVFWVERHFQQHLSKGGVMINQYAMGIKAFLFDLAGHLPRNCLEVRPSSDASVLRAGACVYQPKLAFLTSGAADPLRSSSPLRQP